ncbi:MAG: MaoC family dehydratase N-terminal domain-containing protein [Gammaproteobacteria bacterium]|nr:MaoC family dehydratase N-terminal domain-containing protein [Gammaproteobacteria bacterium]
MAIVYDKLLSRDFGTLEQTYTEKDTILYALGVGLGHDPLDENCLRFVYEEGLKAMPSQSVVLAYPGFWAKEPDTGIDWVQVLHAGQEVILHRPLPAAATVVSTTRITDIADKGPRVGALIVSERTVSDKQSGEDYCTLVTTILCRGDGGCGAPKKASPRPDLIPNREPDKVCDLPTLPQQALIYRLNGDLNPLHASPSVARKAGFRAPILHGLCTFGVATHAILKSCCDYDPQRFKRMRLRFTAPVYPGETISTEIWQLENGEIAFRCRSLEQDKVVINNGFAVAG